jgi:hypothetical protein
MRLKVKKKKLRPSTHALQSLGTGMMSPEGSITFNPSYNNPSNHSNKTKLDRPYFKRSESSFIRVADLDMDNDQTSCSTNQSDESCPNYHHPAVDPPPGVEIDEKEKWVALSDGAGSYSPIAPLAVEKLAATGVATSFNNCMWNPDSKTAKLMKKAQKSDWVKKTFEEGPIHIHMQENTHAKDVLVWTGNFNHDFYGNDLPAIRVAGIVDMSAKRLVDLLVDSTRVKEYNKLSQGREDLVVFQNDMIHDGPFGCSITKVMKSISKPPMIRKHMVFDSILHAKELEDGSGYVVVTRAVHHPNKESSGSSNIIKSEILMGVNVIRKIKGSDERCLMINVNHIRSPMVPVMVAKKIGITAAIGFVNDIRGTC